MTDPEAARLRILDLRRRIEQADDAGAVDVKERHTAELARLRAEATRDYRNLVGRLSITVRTALADAQLDEEFRSAGLDVQDLAPRFPLQRISQWLRSIEKRQEQELENEKDTGEVGATSRKLSVG